MSQLDLFAHPRSSADIVKFPLSRHITFAHFVAQRLDVVDFATGKQFWQQVCRDMRKGLKRNGLTAAETKASIDHLADQVHEALKDLRLQKQYRSEAVILSLSGQHLENSPHGDGAGAAGAMGQGTKFLAGMGRAHETSEYLAAHAREGGAA